MMTKDQVIAIQKDGIDLLGKPLKQDGDYGPKTRWWHYITTLHPKRQELIRCWLKFKYLGVVDDGHNRSPSSDQIKWVDTFVQVSGLEPGVAWCICFMSYCLRVCGFNDWPYHASTYNLIEWAKDNDRITERPLPGDIHCFMYPKGHKLYGSGHGGGLLIVDSTDLLVCDGNVNNAVTVGLRERHGKTFIRTVDDDVPMPTTYSLTTMPRLDGQQDR